MNDEIEKFPAFKNFLETYNGLPDNQKELMEKSFESTNEIIKNEKAMRFEEKVHNARKWTKNFIRGKDNGNQR